MFSYQATALRSSWAFSWAFAGVRHQAAARATAAARTTFRPDPRHRLGCSSLDQILARSTPQTLLLLPPGPHSAWIHATYPAGFLLVLSQCWRRAAAETGAHDCELGSGGPT